MKHKLRILEPPYSYAYYIQIRFKYIPVWFTLTVKYNYFDAINTKKELKQILSCN